MGMRLEGPKIENIVDTNIKSEGLLKGVIQVPADGNFLTIIIKTAKVIGIVKAAKFPDNSPGDKEFPTISKTPVIAITIEDSVIKLIFSLRKKYPNIARNNI